MHNRIFVLVCMMITVALLTGGCATYRVPGAAADFRALGITAQEQSDMTQDSIARELARKPAASFPANIAAIHIQGRDYRSYSAYGRNYGQFSVVSVREAETEEGLDTLMALPMIQTIIPLNALVIHDIEDEESLRRDAASVQADMLLIYTFDTKFGVESTIPALGVITLGLFPNDEARVTCTASAALIDTRTGYVYALAESTANAGQIANAWTSKDAVDQSRRRAEREAFEELVSELTKAWKQVAETYATTGQS